VDAEGNAGDNSNTRSENACSAVDSPEPRRGAGADCRDQTHAGRKSKTHEEACWRQDKDTKAGTNEKLRSIELDEQRGQPERQRKQVRDTCHAPGYELAGPGKVHALGCHAAEACPEDQAEQNDTQRVGGLTNSA